MNNANMKEIFTEMMADLPKDMRLSSHESNAMIEKFMTEINNPLQNIITSMVNKAGEDGKLSEADRRQYSQELMRLIVPYIQSVAKEDGLN
ncbi:MAG: hypothetical protein HRK26_00770 [Rickettsiaceae bacterium H1]|nr:hypothetical protein [Rickettsiaceae bacterium H1]